MNGFVTIKCPSCGGTLYLMRDAGRFTCIHCGKENDLGRDEVIDPAAPAGELEASAQHTADEVAPAAPFEPAEDVTVAPEVPPGEPVAVPEAPGDAPEVQSEDQQDAEGSSDEADADAVVEAVKAEIEELRLRRAAAQANLDSLRSSGSREPGGIRPATVLVALLSTCGLTIFLAAVPSASVAGSPAMSTLRDIVWLLYLLTLAPIVLALVRRGAYTSSREARDKAGAMLDKTISSLDTQIAERTVELEEYAGSSHIP